MPLRRGDAPRRRRSHDVSRATRRTRQGRTGKIIAVNGRVEHTPAQPEQWNAARCLPAAARPPNACARSRPAAPRSCSSTRRQVKLNAGAVLTVREVRSAGGARDVARAAARRGLVPHQESAQRPDHPDPGRGRRRARHRDQPAHRRHGETVLTVVEGAAEFSNPQGSILVNAGEEGTAIPGQAPTKRVILNPEDAVQWALYYPAQVAWRDLPARGARRRRGHRLRRGCGPATPPARCRSSSNAATDVWSRIGASMAYLPRGDTERARAPWSQPAADAEAEVERRAQLAAVLPRHRRRRRRASRARRGAGAGRRRRCGRSCCCRRSSCGRTAATRAREAADRALAAHARIGRRADRRQRSRAEPLRSRRGARAISIARSPSTRATCTRSSTAPASASAPTTRPARARTRTGPRRSPPTMRRCDRCADSSRSPTAIAAQARADFEAAAKLRPRVRRAAPRARPGALPRGPKSTTACSRC